MLNKMKSLEFRFDDMGNVQDVRVSFNDYNGNPNGNLNVTLQGADGDLNLLSPMQLQEIAKQKIIESLLAVPSSEPEPENAL